MESSDSEDDSRSLSEVLLANAKRHGPGDGSGSGPNRPSQLVARSGASRSRSRSSSPVDRRQRARSRSPELPAIVADRQGLARNSPGGYADATEFPDAPVDRSNSKFRHYVFTWNNYPVDAPELLTAIGAEYLAYQPERGASGTPHLQGQ